MYYNFILMKVPNAFKNRRVRHNIILIIRDDITISF